MRLGAAGARGDCRPRSGLAAAGARFVGGVAGAGRAGITRLLVEGGARVASSVVAAGLVDEVWLLRGPDAIGADGVAALEALPLTTITQSPASAFVLATGWIGIH